MRYLIALALTGASCFGEVYQYDANDDLLLKMADLQSWQKKYPESLKSFEELLKKHPDDIQLKRKYASVLLWAGQEDEAIKILESTLNQTLKDP